MHFYVGMINVCKNKENIARITVCLLLKSILYLYYIYCTCISISIFYEWQQSVTKKDNWRGSNDTTKEIMFYQIKKCENCNETRYICQLFHFLFFYLPNSFRLSDNHSHSLSTQILLFTVQHR